MAKKVKLSNETTQKAEEIIAFHGYSSLDEQSKALQKLIPTQW